MLKFVSNNFSMCDRPIWNFSSLQTYEFADQGTNDIIYKILYVKTNFVIS